MGKIVWTDGSNKIEDVGGANATKYIPYIDGRPVMIPWAIKTNLDAVIDFVGKYKNTSYENGRQRAMNSIGEKMEDVGVENATSKAYAEGYRAGVSGVSSAQNPYRGENATSESEWSKGWDAGVYDNEG